MKRFALCALIFMFSCPLLRAAQPIKLSESELLARANIYEGATVEITGYACWNPNYLGEYHLYETLSDCSMPNYNRAIKLILSDIPYEFGASAGVVKAYVVGSYNCHDCLSTGPSQNGYIQVERFTILKRISSSKDRIPGF